MATKSDLQFFENVDGWLAQRASLGAATLGFVPTMGALHEGHARLVERSVRENSATLVSIFVNPTQFNNAEDLAKYPRTLERDLETLRQAGADFVILPRPADLYPDDYRYRMTDTGASDHILCGKTRPGHFQGVLTVVLKLLNLAQAERAYFGEKDYQQLELVREMARAFFVPTEIVGVPTVRNESGLALSSRNARLSPTGLDRAAAFPTALRKRTSIEAVAAELKAAGFEIDYLEEHGDRRYGAVFLEGVRLIDNFGMGELV